MSASIDWQGKVTQVFGRLPLEYMQGGQGFDADGKCLGEVDAQGNLKPQSKPAIPATADGTDGETETLRAQYERVVGKKAPPAMKAETMQARIEEAQGEAD